MNLHELLGAPVDPVSLEPDHVHVWRLSTAIAPEELHRLESLLSADERARADRFHFERDRRSFVACRGSLRLLIAAYSGGPADQIRFCYGPQGKPSLGNSFSPPEKEKRETESGTSSEKAEQTNALRFNVSHSGELALLAFSISSEVGIDVEWMRRDLEFLSLAQASFSPAEYQAVAAVGPEKRAALFYEIWSCKEACIKADGRGISAGLDQFSALGNEGPLWRSVSVAAGSGFADQMRIRVLDVGRGYAAAVAAPRGGWDATLLDLKVNPGSIADTAGLS